jgi:hypothetical protein
LAGATMVFGFWFESTRCTTGLTWLFICALADHRRRTAGQANFGGPRLSGG